MFIAKLTNSAFLLSTQNIVLRRLISTDELVQRRSELFTLEQARQKEKVGRIEKIEIRYLGLPNDKTLVMNKGLSTPYNCAQHLSEHHTTKSVVALLNNKTSWDLHRPLEESCTLQFLNFTMTDPHLVNRCFWRTCSFMLGAVLQDTFKPEAGLNLHSFPSPNLKTGSFVHDIVLSHNNWISSTQELKAISAGMIKLAAKNLPIERLEINSDLALEIFKDNPFKTEQLPSIANQNNGKVIVYRVGNHIDMSRGPMIGFTGFLGKCTISAIHKLLTEGDQTFYRVQGVGLPTGFILNHFTYGILEDRSRKLNPAHLPNEPFEDSSMESQIA